jgi:hypothetical protein
MKFDTDNIIVPKNSNVSKNIFKLQKRCEKLKLTLDTLTHLPQQSDIRGGGYQNTDNVVIKNCNKDTEYFKTSIVLTMLQVYLDRQGRNII